MDISFQHHSNPASLSVSFPSGPGTFSGPRLTTPYPRGRRYPAPPFRFPVSANRTTGRTCARPRTTTDALLIITPCWCMVSNRGDKFVMRCKFLEFPQVLEKFAPSILFLYCFHFQSMYPRQSLTVLNYSVFNGSFVCYISCSCVLIFFFSFWEISLNVSIPLSSQYLWSLAILALGNRAIKSWRLSHLSFSFICFPDFVHSRKPLLNLLHNWFHRDIDSTGRRRLPCSDTSHQHHYSGYIL